MSKIAVAVKIRVKAGQRDAMTAAVQPGLETAQGEAGTLTYLFTTLLMRTWCGSMSCTRTMLHPRHI